MPRTIERPARRLLPPPKPIASNIWAEKSGKAKPSTERATYGMVSWNCGDALNCRYAQQLRIVLRQHIERCLLGRAERADCSFFVRNSFGA
jgi:hypothetical protein